MLGLAWAANLRCLDQIGLYDAAVVGGGDNAILHAAFGAQQNFLDRRNFDALRSSGYLSWAEKFQTAIGGRIGYVPGRAYHLWHGDLGKRDYLKRHTEFASLGFSLGEDIVIGTNGAWHWRRNRPDLEAYFRRYLLNRAEDGE